MRIGVFVGAMHSPNIGGGYTFQISIINAFCNLHTNLSHELYFYYRGEDSYFKNKDTENIKFINLNDKKYRINNKILKRRKNEQFQFDSILEQDKIEFVYYLAPCVEKCSLPYLLTIWDLGHRVIPYFPEVTVSGWTFENREKFCQEYLPKASYIMIGNEAGKEQINRYFGIDSERIVTNPMITPDDVFKLEPDNSILVKHNLKPEKYIFYPAQFWPHKNHIRILKAMNTLKEKGIKAVFTGSDVGNMTYIKEKVKEYELEEDVFFLGFVTREEILALYKNAYALVYASMLGPDNIPPLEAMALNCPVICAEYEGAKEQLSDCALYFNPLEHHELLTRLEALDDKALRESLSKKGLLLANSCNVKNYVQKVIEIFDDFTKIRECWSSNEKYLHL